MYKSTARNQYLYKDYIKLKRQSLSKNLIMMLYANSANYSRKLSKYILIRLPTNLSKKEQSKDL
jgi:hypothetical protein